MQGGDPTIDAIVSAYRRILTPYTKEGVELLRILLYTIGGQADNG